MDDDHRPASCDGCQSVGKPAAVHRGVHRAATSHRSQWNGCRSTRRSCPGGGTQLPSDALPAVPKPPVRRTSARLVRPSTRPEGIGPDRPGPLYRVPDLHGGLPLRPALLQLGRSSQATGGAATSDYDGRAPGPRAEEGTVMKCDFCPDMPRAGTLPYCIQGCPNRAIYYGDLEEDIATNGRAVVSASRAPWQRTPATGSRKSSGPSRASTTSPATGRPWGETPTTPAGHADRVAVERKRPEGGATRGRDKREGPGAMLERAGARVREEFTVGTQRLESRTGALRHTSRRT